MTLKPARDASSKIERHNLDSAEYHYQLGLDLSQQGQIKKAIASFQKAIELQPDLAIAHCNLGSLLTKIGNLQQAIVSFETTIELQPQLVEAYFNLGLAQGRLGKLKQARTALETAVSLKPDWAEAHYNLGNVLLEQGLRDEAIAAYQSALDSNSSYHLAKLALAIAQIPVIYTSEIELESQREKYRQQLQDLANYYQNAGEPERAEAAEIVGSNQPFYLTYQGKCDRELQQIYGGLMQSLMASRYPQWSRALPIPKLATDSKIRIGFVSGFFNHHAVWKIILQGWVKNLDRSEFELFGYFTGERRDKQTVRAAKLCDRFEGDLQTVEEWAEKIVEDDIHVLIYPEFGMDTMAVQLGCLRLAPLQLASWGHPETSGLPTIDYFLSSELMEPQNSQAHYSEQLVNLPNLGICYDIIDVRPKAVTKPELGIAESDIMFWCCQSLYKYLPQHDDIFPRIARELDNARFVFIQLPSEFSTNIFRQRLSRAFKQFDLDYRNYCVFLPRLSSSAFAGATAIADVYLDNISWSGGNTTLESTVYNLPLVTVSGKLMRERHTTAILKMMGIESTIAQNKEEYVEIAVRLGRNADYRQDIARQIALNKEKCYGDLKPVRALEDFLFVALKKQKKYNNAEARIAFQIAEKHYRHGQMEAAKQQYLKTLAIESGRPEALYALGTIEQQQGNLAEAESYFDAAVKAQPDFLKSWFSLGNLRQARGDFATAERAYRQAIALRSDSAPICNNLGYVLQQQEKWSEAAEYYQRALTLMPNCREAEANLGNALFAQEKLDSKQQTYYAELNYQLGMDRLQVGDEGTAEIYYRQAILMQPDLAQAHYELGWILQHQQNLLEATKHYERAIELDNNLGQAYYSLGEVHQDLGDLDRATANFKQGAKLINPQYAKAIESARDAAPLSVDNCETPARISGTVMVGGHEYPAIPPVPTGTKRPFWSVVIPIVNRPEFFPETLACVLSQWTGAEDMEIIVLDNGSNPPQNQIPDVLGRGIIRYCRLSETIPLQENWNTAVSLCRGQWVHLLHSDDYVLPGFYDRFKASLANCADSVGGAFTGHKSITEDRQILHTQDHNLGNYRGIVKGWIKEIGFVNSTSPPSMIIKRAAYEKLGGYRSDILFTCDWELYKRNASFYDWWYEPGFLAHYRRQTNSVTVAENMNGSSGFDHLKAIEISESYLPPKLCAEITAKSRINHFLWCIDRAKMPLRAGNFDAVTNLLLAALKIDGSTQAVTKLQQWLEAKLAVPLVKKLAVAGSSGDKEKDMLIEMSQTILSARASDK